MKKLYEKPLIDVVSFDLTENIMEDVVIPGSPTVSDGTGEGW